MQREITFFKDLATEEKNQLLAAANDKTLSDEERSHVTREITEAIDRKARSQFSIHARSAEWLGFKGAASEMQNYILPRLRRQIQELETERSELLQMINQLSLDYTWRWNQRAEAVGMKEQYDFFYRYASRLCTRNQPVSLPISLTLRITKSRHWWTIS
jgi:hypothetical protein